MQFTTSTQQLTTCPQCDNVVRVDADFCNICGKRLRPTSTSSYLSTSQQEDEEEEEYEDDEYYLDEDDEHGSSTTALSMHNRPTLASTTLSASEILDLLRHLQEQTH